MNFQPFVVENVNEVSSEALRQAVDKHGLVLIRNAQAMDTDAWRNFCQPFGEFLKWDFGDVNELKLKPETPSYLYSHEAVPLHWDGAFAQSPSLLMFYCHESEGVGGETLFVDTQAVLESTPAEERALWQRLKLQYHADRKVHFGGTFSCDMLSPHPHKPTTLLRYAEPVETELNPVTLNITGLPAECHDAFIQTMREKLYHPNVCYAHAWQTGDIVIADNHRLLHGRNALKDNLLRHILRIQII